MIELIIIFLIQAIAVHYIERGLTAVDAHLVSLIKTGVSIPEIKAYIQTSKEREARVLSFAKRIMEQSQVLPMVPEGAVTNEDKVELFLQVLKIGYGFSRSAKCELMLPGSMIGPSVFTFFTAAKKGVPKLVRRGVEINISKAASSKYDGILHGTLHIIPISSNEEHLALWERYKALFEKAQGDKLSADILIRREILGSTQFRIYSVSGLTAEYCYLAEEPMANAKEKALLQLEKLYANIWVARIQQWYEGISAMIRGVKELSNLLVLPEDEVSKINQIWDELKALFERRGGHRGRG